MLGHVADIREVWAAAHIAVLPSRREGLPKSLLEAAACGRAIVATDVPGCRVIARDGVNALLVPPDDPAALADAIERAGARSGAKADLWRCGPQNGGGGVLQRPDRAAKPWLFTTNCLANSPVLRRLARPR